MAESSQISKVLPRHIEIMNRLLLGQKEVDIAQDLGMSQSRISIIVNSPLFKLEMKKQLMKRQARILSIEDNIIDAGETASQLLKDTVSNENIVLPYRIDAGNKALAHLFGRILRQMPSIEPPESENPEDLPYEKRLEREIILRETTFVPKNGGQSGSFSEPDSPPPELIESEEEDALNDILNDEVDVEDVIDIPTNGGDSDESTNE